MHIHAAPVERYACTPRFWTSNPCIYMAYTSPPVGKICIGQRIEHILPFAPPPLPSPPTPPVTCTGPPPRLISLRGGGRWTRTHPNPCIDLCMPPVAGWGGGDMQFRTRVCHVGRRAFSDRFVKGVRGTGPGVVGGRVPCLFYFSYFHTPLHVLTKPAPSSGPAARLQPCSGLEAAKSA